MTVRYTEEPLEGMWGPCNRSREPEIGTEDEVVPMIGIELGPDCSNTETSTNTLSSNEFENNTKEPLVGAWGHCNRSRVPSVGTVTSSYGSNMGNNDDIYSSKDRDFNKGPLEGSWGHCNRSREPAVGTLSSLEGSNLGIKANSHSSKEGKFNKEPLEGSWGHCNRSREPEVGTISSIESSNLENKASNHSSKEGGYITKESLEGAWGHCNRSRDPPVGTSMNTDCSNKGNKAKCHSSNDGKMGPRTRTTAKFLQLHRRAKWERKVGWDENDINRIFKSTEMNPEDIQDFSVPMALVGGDVVSLYPNLNVAKIATRMKEAILESGVTWSNIDYLEATRYIALNWDSQKCSESSLRRVLPRRRGRTGTRPGIKGAGPRGKIRGDQEQWIFDPSIKLSEGEKKEIIATVVCIATEELFKNHFYSFGGVIYHQKGGGPIGLRGTCAVARICMQIYDRKLKTSLDELCLKIWMKKRYKIKLL